MDNFLGVARPSGSGARRVSGEPSAWASVPPSVQVGELKAVRKGAERLRSLSWERVERAEDSGVGSAKRRLVLLANVCSDQPNLAKRSGSFSKSHSSGTGATVTFAGVPRRRPTSYVTAFGGGCLQTLSVGRGFGWVPNLICTPGSHGGGESSKA